MKTNQLDKLKLNSIHKMHSQIPILATLHYKDTNV